MQHFLFDIGSGTVIGVVGASVTQSGVLCLCACVIVAVFVAGLTKGCKERGLTNDDDN